MRATVIHRRTFRAKISDYEFHGQRGTAAALRHVENTLHAAGIVDAPTARPVVFKHDQDNRARLYRQTRAVRISRPPVAR